MRTTKTNKLNEDTNLESGFVANIATFYRAVFLVLFVLTVCNLTKRMNVIFVYNAFMLSNCQIVGFPLSSGCVPIEQPVAFAASFDKVI